MSRWALCITTADSSFMNVNFRAPFVKQTDFGNGLVRPGWHSLRVQLQARRKLQGGSSFRRFTLVLSRQQARIFAHFGWDALPAIGWHDCARERTNLVSRDKVAMVAYAQEKLQATNGGRVPLSYSPIPPRSSRNSWLKLL